MKPQETIKCIDEVLQSDYHFDETLGYQLTSDDFDWLEKSKEALNKQIPKEAVSAAMDGFKPEYAATLLCPTCSRQIINVWNKKDYKPKYCHYCGQALDWSENNA